MSAIGVLARAGAATAFGLGLWLGPQAMGVAVADSGRGQADAASAEPGSSQDAPPAGARHSRRSTPVGVRSPLAASSVSPSPVRGSLRQSDPIEAPADEPPADEPPAAEPPAVGPAAVEPPAVEPRAKAVGAQSDVVAIPQTPLFTALRLQEIPVVGPLMVTPVVDVVNHIPMVSDVLHPILGYPLQPGPAPRDVRVISFDGTGINAHFMPADGLPAGRTAPTVFLAPALGMPGATNVDGTPFDLILADLGGEVGVADLRKAGYNVVTWDPRGEWFSGGRLEIDSPGFEARDVSSVIDWVATQPEAQLDGAGDPRMGMAGASYGGGVQLVTAATDHRVDAIVPVLAWNTLNSSLYKSGAFKTGSASALGATLVFTLARMNPAILPIIIYGNLTGQMTAAGQDLLARSGPGAARGFPDLVSRITAPTLLIQGTADTLTSLKEADLTAQTLVAQGVPTKVQWICGGHGLCIHNFFDLSDGVAIVKGTLRWLDRYVKGDEVSTGPAFEWVDQRDQHLGTDTYPAPSAEQLVARRTSPAVLPLVPFIAGSGPMFLVFPFGGTWAVNSVSLRTPDIATTTYIAGEPQLRVSYSGTGTGDFVYAQIVNPATGFVLGNQITPVPVTLDGQPHTVSVPLEPIAHTLNPGERITVQLFSWSASHAASWSLGSLNVTDMRLSLPMTHPEVIDPHQL